MCTRETQSERAKKLIFELLAEGNQPVEKIKAHLHADGIMSQDHSIVQEIFYRLINDFQNKNIVTLSQDSLMDATVISLVAG